MCATHTEYLFWSFFFLHEMRKANHQYTIMINEHDKLTKEHSKNGD